MQHELRDTLVELDGNEFRGQHFINCTLVYRGGVPPVIVGCRLTNTRFSFADAAERTLAFMATMCHGGFRPVIERTFESILRGKQGGDTVLH
jgi:hypothetical protein